MSQYETWDIAVKCIGLAAVLLLLAMLFVPPILRGRGDEEAGDETEQ